MKPTIKKNLGLTLGQLEKFWSPVIRAVADPLVAHGFECRVIGGAVRDHLLGRRPRDIDLATTAGPTAMIYLFQAMAMTIDVGGIQHGTVKVQPDSHEDFIEVTTLDYWIQASDDQVVVRSTDDGSVEDRWWRDAHDRDFTVNAMSMDREGTVYDYTGGIADLHNKRIRCLRDFDKAVVSRPTDVFRFLRLLNKFDNPRYPKQYKNILSDNHGVVDQVDGHRQWREFKDILSGRNGWAIVQLMDQTGILNSMGLEGFNLDGIDYIDVDPISVVGYQLGATRLEVLCGHWEFNMMERARAYWFNRMRNDHSTGIDLLHDGVDPLWIKDLLVLRGDISAAVEFMTRRF
jgi:hypothetical protein